MIGILELYQLEWVLLKLANMSHIKNQQIENNSCAVTSLLLLLCFNTECFHFQKSKYKTVDYIYLKILSLQGSCTINTSKATISNTFLVHAWSV